MNMEVDMNLSEGEQKEVAHFFFFSNKLEAGLYYRDLCIWKGPGRYILEQLFPGEFSAVMEIFCI